MASSLLKPSLLLAAPARRSPAAFCAVTSVGRSSRGLRALVSRRAPLGHGQAVLRRPVVTARSSEEGKEVEYNKEFGYSRKDIILIGVGLIALGYALYYGLQAMGMEAGFAGNWVQLIVFLGICVGWVSTYIFRVATKQMTYVKQLENYEEAVIRKRVEEMTEAEMGQLAEEMDAEAARKAARGQAPKQ